MLKIKALNVISNAIFFLISPMIIPLILIYCFVSEPESMTKENLLFDLFHGVVN